MIIEKDKKENFLIKIARFIKYHKILVLYIIFLISAVYMYLFSNNGLIMRFKLEREKKTLEKQIEIENKKQDSLKNKIKDIQTSDWELEKIAREKYGMTRDSEKIYRIYIDSTK